MQVWTEVLQNSKFSFLHPFLSYPVYGLGQRTKRKSIQFSVRQSSYTFSTVLIIRILINLYLLQWLAASQVGSQREAEVHLFYKDVHLFPLFSVLNSYWCVHLYVLGLEYFFSLLDWDSFLVSVQILVGNLKGKTPRGWYRHRWKDSVDTNLKGTVHTC